MKKQGTCLAALLGALCLFPQGVLAEETVSATMKPVVVTATKTEHSLGETTADVSVVTREQIEKMPANNVLDVMRTMPGVTVDSARSFYGTSTQNKVIIRGMGGDDVNGRVLVLMDGLPVMAAGTNIFNWDTISLDTVERIEVVRGPASALYGSSAMGGVINIITRKPTEEGFKTMAEKTLPYRGHRQIQLRHFRQHVEVARFQRPAGTQPQSRFKPERIQQCTREGGELQRGVGVELPFRRNRGSLHTRRNVLV